MLQSKLFSKTRRESPKDEVSRNADLLIRAGFIDKVAAGIYTYLPLGLAALRNIQQIIREEINALGAQEILMPALIPKELWTTTGRWDSVDVNFKVDSVHGKSYALGFSHEEVVTPLAQKFVFSHRDLPFAVYQIQDKFRDEPRAKSGILRGREFNMKDLYSFHATEDDLNDYYNRIIECYHKIFSRCGIHAMLTEAGGGVFSDTISHEFQVSTPYGEDIVYVCVGCGKNQNKELVKSDACPECGAARTTTKAIEVGNIYKLGGKFSKPFDFKFADMEGKRKEVLMGCYGIGPSRVMGTIAEVYADAQGLLWPPAISPVAVHLIALGRGNAVAQKCEKVYDTLRKNGLTTLFDDRDESPGVKLKDADLIGIPLRAIVGDRTGENEVEIKARWEAGSRTETLSTLVGAIARALKEFPEKT